ncbi:CDGSH iron-sulfur domain-containing protein [Spongiactinospora rosea]|uniref:CDGSH iron-sulfur domain-containing protein n=1 Tax=Spongiactinospora rosea TaxID=2248750 RepID=UPI0018F7CC1F|nr:CDGSH iron-sulfur domain-containing protein [Spongiactinospora rosea]
MAHEFENVQQAEPWAACGPRLRASVIRPLAKVADEPDGDAEIAATPPGDDGSPGALEARLWESAIDATTLRVQEGAGASAELREAVAALQELSLRLAAEDVAAERLARLRALHEGLDGGIEVAEDGPYLVTNVSSLHDWLGRPILAGPQVALCRCGASESKPFCDGGHEGTGFSGAKDPNRVPDHRESHPGVSLTVLDNRGTCAHSGFCTDRVPAVFRVGKEPFVAASGGRLDEIVGAVRDCPSGALSFALGGVEQRETVDSDREPAIEVSKDGPYRITGGVPLCGQGGRDAERNEGASLEHYSLCRCGHSQNKPFCSGMHWYAGFHDPVEDPSHEPTLFEWAGGLPALTRMTRLFYGKYVPEDPLIGPLFAAMHPDHPNRVAKWLGEVFGGPKAYSQEYGGYDRMIAQHLGKRLSEPQRARWVALMCQAAQQAGLPADAEFRAAFVAYLEWGSRIALENSQSGARPPEKMPVPRWWWVCNATPGARVSALAEKEPEEQVVTLPGAGEPVSFAAHIKPLFRAMDRNSMRFAFDLWSYEDVKTHSAEILKRLSNGSMPCDGGWSPEWLAVFRRWSETGKPQ